MTIISDFQQAANPDYRARSIRIDVYVEDNADTVYIVEMQARNTGELSGRPGRPLRRWDREDFLEHKGNQGT